MPGVRTTNSNVVQVPVELTESSTMNLPLSGVWEFDYVSTTKAPVDSVPATDAQVEKGRVGGTFGPVHRFSDGEISPLRYPLLCYGQDTTDTLNVRYVIMICP